MKLENGAAPEMERFLKIFEVFPVFPVFSGMSKKNEHAYILHIGRL
jgi:hypothetical protein